MIRRATCKELKPDSELNWRWKALGGPNQQRITVAKYRERGKGAARGNSHERLFIWRLPELHKRIFHVVETYLPGRNGCRKIAVIVATPNSASPRCAEG